MARIIGALSALLLGAWIILAGATSPALAQGCGPQNPNCIVPTAPPGTSDNRAASTAFVQNAISGFSGFEVGAGCTPIGRGAVTSFFSDCTTVTGTANAIILTPTFGATPTTPQLVLFTRFTFQATATNTTATTIRIGAAGPGPYNAYTNSGAALAGGEIITGRWYTFGFDPALNSAAGGWRLIAGDLASSSLLPSNNTWTGFNIFAPLTAASPAVTINPLAGSLGVGLLINQTSPAGSISAGTPGEITYFNGIKVTGWNVRDTSAGGTELFAPSGVSVFVNGSSAYAPNGMFGFASDMRVFTIAPLAGFGAIQSYNSILARAIVHTSPPAGVIGFSITSVNANVITDPGITGVASVVGMESDVTVLGGAPGSKFAYVAVQGAVDVSQGTVADAAYYVTTQGGTAPGWKALFQGDGVNGTVVSAGGCVICMRSTHPLIAFGVDLSAWTFTTAFKSNNFQVSGAGGIGAQNAIFQIDQNGNTQGVLVKNNTTGAATESSVTVQTGTANALANFLVVDQTGSPDAALQMGSGILRTFVQMNSVNMTTWTRGGGVAIGTAVDCGANCLNAGALRINNVAVTAAGITALTGDVTATGPGSAAATLATVNSNVGTFGSATQSVQFTVNGKGLITAAANVTVTPSVGSITGLGTGVATALGTNIGSAGAPLTFNGVGGTPSSIALANGTGLPTTGLTGTLQAAQEPAHTGDVTNSAGSLALTIANNAVTLAKLATQATNTVLANVTAGLAVPTALAVASCDTATKALQWTTNTGFACNTAITAAAAPASGITGTLGVTQGGTGTGTAFTAGSIVFAGASGVYTQDNANLFWDDSNNRLGLGLAVPLAQFHQRIATDVNFQITNNSGATIQVIDNANSVLQPLNINVSTLTLNLSAFNIVTLPQTAAAQSGTMCYNVSGAVTYDATLGCLASFGAAKNIRRELSDQECIEIVTKLRVIEFTRKPGYGGESDAAVQIGFEAEQVDQIDQRLTARRQDGTLGGVRYAQNSAIYACAFRAVVADNDNLRQEVEQLKRISK